MDQDDDASIQILEPDVDQQYVPERPSQQRKKEARAETNANASSSVRQKPPVLIVERQVVQPQPLQAPPPPTTEPTALPALQQPTAVAGSGAITAAPLPATSIATPAEPLLTQEATRIVNIVNEPERIAARESDNWWQQRINDIVSLTLRFFAMAITVFLSLVYLNPPFVQENATASDASSLQKRPASLSRAALWAGVAGAAFLLLPPLWGVASSRFFPDDILMATGLRQPARKH